MTKVDARTLLGDPSMGKRNGWVFECLEASRSPADRLNAITALVWLGYGEWVNYEQDQANQHWVEARRRLAEGRFAELDDDARVVADVLGRLPS